MSSKKTKVGARNGLSKFVRRVLREVYPEFISTREIVWKLKQNGYNFQQHHDFMGSVGSCLSAMVKHGSTLREGKGREGGQRFRALGADDPLVFYRRIRAPNNEYVYVLFQGVMEEGDLLVSRRVGSKEEAHDAVLRGRRYLRLYGADDYFYESIYDEKVGTVWSSKPDESEKNV